MNSLRPLQKNKQGSYYIPLISIFAILFLIIAFIQIKTYFDPTDKNAAAKRITRDLGSKQGEILRAVREGERIRTYTEDAARIARIQTASEYVCGTPYLNRYQIGQGTCDQTPATYANSIFTTALAAYPKGSLSTMFGEPISTEQAGGTILTFTGEYRIPIAGGEIAGQTGTAGSVGAGGTFSGTIGGWPTDDPRITSLFGKRDLGSQRGSSNHAGIDIGTKGEAGRPISTLTDGIATFYSAGDASFVVVDSGSAVFEYIHISPGGVVNTGRSVPVKSGQVIAVSSAYANGEHLHLQTYIKDVTKSTIERLSTWNGHIGSSDSQPSGMTYAVTRAKDGRAYLDPLCFFDRSFIDEKIRGSSTDWYARRVPNSLYETCDAYERDLGLSRRFKKIDTSSTSVASAPTNTATPTTTPPANTQNTTAQSTTPSTASTSTNQRVRGTYANLERAGLLDDVVSAAEDNAVEPALLFALISQESEGVADVVSTTGCVGIGQFCYSTAAGYEDLFPQLTKCDCSGAACRSQATRACTPQNDGRFNAANSIKASGRLIGGHVNRYASYDQKEALALIAYNAGPGVVRQVLEKTGPNPSWEQMRNVLESDTSINYGKGIDPVSKRREVVGYVDIILFQLLPEWGGMTMSGSQYTSDIPGFYTLKLAIRIDLTKTAAAVIEKIEEEMKSCTTTECIRTTVTDTARANGASITREALNTDTGCMSASERAQAYLAQQFLWCKRSPDNACGCELFESVEATYIVTPASTRITKLKGETVNPTFSAMPGVSFDTAGETTSMASIPLLKELNDADTSRVESRPSIELVLSEKRDETRVALPLRTDLSVDTLWKSDKYGGLALAQGELDEQNRCVLPSSLKVEAYCLKSADDSFEPVVFYVDMRAKSTPEFDVREYEAKSGGGLSAFGGVFGGGNTNVRFFTDKPFPYAKIVVKETVNGVVREEEFYFRVTDSVKGAYEVLNSVVGALGYTSTAGVRTIERYSGDVIVTAPSPSYKHLYEIRVPAAAMSANKEAWLVLLDTNLNEGARMKLDMSLTKDLSGFVIPKPEDILTGGVPIPGTG